MKRKISFFLCIAILVCLAGTAFGSVSFKKFTLTFKDKASFTSIVSDTTSRAMTVKNQDHARFTVNTNSSKKNVFRAYSGGVVSIEHFVKKSTKNVYLYYTKDLNSGATVYLQGRPDSSVSTCTVTGNFGAG